MVLTPRFQGGTRRHTLKRRHLGLIFLTTAAWPGPRVSGHPTTAEERLDVTTNEPIMASVAGRYASALFELAQDENRVSEVEKDLGTFLSLFDESEDLRRMVRSPIIDSEQQSKAILALFEKAGIGQLTGNFFKLITRNRRLFAAPDMVRAFQSLAAKARGEVTADVASAQPLNDEQVAALKAKLKETIGKDVQLSLRVDPSLLGGLVVKVGSRMVDGSLRTKLANLKAALASSA